MKITVFGSGYVGLVTGASLANHGHIVLCVDIDEAKIRRLEHGEMPFYEPGLKELVLKNKEKSRLSFSSSISQGIQFGEALFNCVGTPSLTNGAAELDSVFSITKQVALAAQGYKVLINKSTVPPGTARKCCEIIREQKQEQKQNQGQNLEQEQNQEQNSKAEIEVVSNPEFLKQGNAVYDFNHPDKIVVGATSEKAFQVLRKIYHGLIKTYIPFLEMNWETAEMTKYANNSFLATKISFINEIANICQRTGADVKLVAKAIGMDYRIGPKFLNAGIGYGGSCFPKDVRALAATAQENGYQAKLLEEVDALNERHKQEFSSRILNKLAEIQGKTISLWGLSFKPKTSDLRHAPSLQLIAAFLQQGIKVKVYDPVALDEARKIFGDKIDYCASPQEALTESDILVIVTEWDEFRNVDFTEMKKKMNHSIIFDGRNIYEPEEVREEGFEYYGVGRG